MGGGLGPLALGRAIIKKRAWLTFRTLVFGLIPGEVVTGAPDRTDHEIDRCMAFEDNSRGTLKKNSRNGVRIVRDQP
jgi:hypothetical protein